MTPEEYFSQRLEQQISWYESNALRNKRTFQVLKVGEIAVAAVTPFMIAHSDVDGGFLHIFAASLSILIAIVAAMLGAFKFQEKWIQFQTVAEQLKHEKYMYLAQAGVYEKHPDFPAFVKRVEVILIRENADWMKLVSAQTEQNGDNPDGTRQQKPEVSPQTGADQSSAQPL